MKNRNIVFGYQYQNGCVVIHPNERDTVIRIFRTYQSGKSLLKIAEMLNRDGIEYMPGVVGWNKARLMRIIEDKRYLGDNTYPAMIDELMYERLKLLKASKNNQKNIDRAADIFRLDVPLICSNCGTPMLRRYEKGRTTWSCRNCECKQSIKLNDDALIRQIVEQMNQFIENPDLIEIPDTPDFAPSIEVTKCNNEISRMLETHGIDKDSLRKKMLEAVSLKYRDINPTVHIAKRMKADFEKSSPLSAFSAKLCSRTVKAVRLYPDCTVSLILINDQTVGKESNI